jgi:23S rRNA (guanosine2251-2'-O)-methyltransferase
VLLATGRRPAPILDEILAIANSLKVPVREASSHELHRVAGGLSSQGVAAQIAVGTPPDLRALLAEVSRQSQPGFLLVLDQVQDPHNLGALLRTAESAGVNGVVIPRRGSAGVSGSVAKASAGASSYVPLVEVTNLVRALDEIKKGGLWLVGLDETAKDDLYATSLRGPVALVIGGEARGLRRLTKAGCDLVVRLPMFGSIESLNVAVAGSIAMYEVVRQRLKQ